MSKTVSIGFWLDPYLKFFLRKKIIINVNEIIFQWLTDQLTAVEWYVIKMLHFDIFLLLCDLHNFNKRRVFQNTITIE